MPRPDVPQAAALTGKERLTFYRGLADAQLAAWDGAAGWFFWNYKLLINGSGLDGWDLGKSIELGSTCPKTSGTNDSPAAAACHGLAARAARTASRSFFSQA